jgi:hypothetical protein
LTHPKVARRRLQPCKPASAKSFLDPVGHTQGVGNDRQGRIHCADGGKKACVGDIEVIELMRFAVQIEDGTRAVRPKARRAGLMRRAADGNILAEIEVTVQEN